MRTTTAVALTVGLLLVVAYGPAAFGSHWFATDGGRSEDTAHLSLLYETVAGHIRAGSYPWWTPEFGCGYPAFAAWMYGLLYPGLALFLVLPPEAAWAWTAILHTVLGAVGMVRLARQAGCEDAGAAAAGVVFGLSEYLVVRALVGHLNLVLPLAWAPWVFLYLLRTIDGDRRALPLLAVTTALGLLSGHVQTWFYLAGAAVVIVGFRAGRPVAMRWGPRLLLAGAVALALTAVQWLPTLALIGLSDGGVADLDLRAQGSLTLPEGAARLVPGILGRHAASFPWGPYGGGAEIGHEMVGLAGAWLLVPLASLRRERAAPWVLIAFLAAWIAGGVHNVLGEWFHLLPGFTTSRAPARAQVLIVLAVPVLVGLGVDAWLARRDRVRLLGGAGVAALVVALSAVAAARLDGVGSAQVRPAVLLSVLATGAVTLALIGAAPAGRRRFLPAAALAAAAFVVGLPPVLAESSAAYRMPWEEAVPASLRDGRMHLDGNLFPPIEQRGVRTTRQLSHVDSAAYRALLHKEWGAAEAYWLDVRTVARRGWSGRMYEPPPGASPVDLLLLRPLETIGAGRVFASPGAPVPLDDEGVRGRISAGGREAYVRRADGFTRSEPVPGNVAAVDPGSPNSRRVVVESPAGGTVVLSERWMPGWSAQVDGEPVDVLVAQTALAAVYVPPGRHEVTMRYRAPGLFAGLLAGLAGLVTLVVLVLRPRRSAA